MKPEVLIVEDSVTVRVELRGILASAGFSTTVCDSVTSARRALAARRFSLVVLDVVLPDGDGIALLREIRSNEATRELPVMLLSTEAEVGHRIRGLVGGANEFLGKPADKEHLIRRARELSGLAAEPERDDHSLVKRKKVLVVDDSPTFLQKVSDVLKKDGHDVVAARSGEDALALLEAQRVDAVLLDVVMPGLDGVETCRRIKENARLKSMPVLMMTASGADESRIKAIAAGADELIVKAEDLELVRAQLRQLLRRKYFERLPQRLGQTAPGSPEATSEQRPSALFEQVVQASGLPKIIAPSTIARALRQAGIEPDQLGRHNLSQCLPVIRQTLTVFLGADECASRMKALAALAEDANHSGPT